MNMETTDQDVWDAKQFLIYCAESHPRAQIADYVKRVHQTEFGCSQINQTEEEALRRLKEEIGGMTEKMKRRPYFQPFCGNFCRMNLSVSKLLSPELMNRIFVVSNKKVPKDAWFRFEEKLRLFWELCRERPELFRFTVEEVADYLRNYREAGYPPVRHSPEYIKAYEPAYRVVRKEYGRYPEVYAAMEKCLREKGKVNVAIDGNSAAGKTEMARVLASLFDCNVFHADDFFLPLEKRTPERMSEVGGNMERERFQAEICEKVKEGKSFSYRPYDCSVMRFGAPVEVQPKKINIFEGSYTMHPDLRQYYDVKVFLSIPPTEQEARLLERNGGFMIRRFLDEWIPKENAYFNEMNVRENCDFIF